MFLEKILTVKKEEVEERRKRFPMAALVSMVNAALPVRDFFRALEGNCRIIAEIKRSSPSRGKIREDLDPVAVGRIYASNGAAAVSVLTDGPFFGGRTGDLTEVREQLEIPVLRKDFIIDAYQIYETRAMGADAVLLIAAVLHDSRLADFVPLAKSLGLCPLVEVHDENDLERALNVDARVIGINNRDLRTFSTDIRTSLRLFPHIPPDRTVVSESGIKSRRDIERLMTIGVRIFLVGETLMAAEDIGGKLRELAGWGGGCDGR